VQSNGGHSAVVSLRQLKPSQASYLSQLINGYSFGPRAARNMERRLGLPARYLDTPAVPGATDSALTVGESSPSPYQVIPAPTLAGSLTVLLKELGTLQGFRLEQARHAIRQAIENPEMRDEAAAQLEALIADRDKPKTRQA
jgi:hypothetical protein